MAHSFTPASVRRLGPASLQAAGLSSMRAQGRSRSRCARRSTCVCPAACAAGTLQQFNPHPACCRHTHLTCLHAQHSCTRTGGRAPRRQLAVRRSSAPQDKQQQSQQDAALAEARGLDLPFESDMKSFTGGSTPGNSGSSGAASPGLGPSEPSATRACCCAVLWCSTACTHVRARCRCNHVT